MTQNEIELVLQRGPDDPPENAPEFQEELRAFNKSLRSAGVTFSGRGMTFDSVDALGYQLPEFLITLSQAIGPTVGVILVAWLRGRAGRKVRLKFDNNKIEAEAKTAKEVEELLLLVEKFRQDHVSKGVTPEKPGDES